VHTTGRIALLKFSHCLFVCSPHPPISHRRLGARVALKVFNLFCSQAAAILVFEKVMKKGGESTRYKAWGPNNSSSGGSSDKKSPHHGLGIGGIGMLNRNSVWGGRLAGATTTGGARFAGGRFGLGHGGWQAGGAPAAASSSTSLPIDERERRLTAEDRAELRRMRVSLEELSAKMDAILS
jgi:hypothetical protein